MKQRGELGRRQEGTKIANFVLAQNYPQLLLGYTTLHFQPLTILQPQRGFPKPKLDGLLQRGLDSLGSLVRRAKANYTSTGSYDIFVSPRECTAQFDVVRETLDGYFDSDGNMLINPTYKQYLTDINNACSELGLRNMSTKTVWKYTKLFDWGFKVPSLVNNLDKKETMEKRVDFSTLLLQLANDDTSELLFQDEMSFFAYKNRAKRLAPKDHEKVFFENPTPSRHDALCISTFMTKDYVVDMTFRYQNTDTKLFLAELLPVLLKAHRKIDPRKKIVLVLDNARYHPEAEIKKLLETASKSFHQRGGSIRQFEIRFTSPNSPDLNLVEYYNRYFKSALRRALELFSFLTFKRPAKQRGRKPNPAAKPKKNPKPASPRPIVTIFSKANLLTLAQHVYTRIIAAERPNGNWQHALQHVVK
jgi:transposase